MVVIVSTANVVVKTPLCVNCVYFAVCELTVAIVFSIKCTTARFSDNTTQMKVMCQLHKQVHIELCLCTNSSIQMRRSRVSTCFQSLSQDKLR